MANVVSGNVWVLDTVGGTGNQLAPPGTAICIWSILWTQMAAGINTAELRDCGGRTVWADAWRDTGTCSRFIAYTKPLECDGLGLVSLTSGKLLIQIG